MPDETLDVVGPADVDGVPEAAGAQAPAADVRAAGDTPAAVCDKCGKGFPSAQSMGGHKRHCKAIPAAGRPKAAPIPAASWTAQAARERGVDLAGDAVAGAAAAEAAIHRAADSGGGTAAIVAELAKAKLGVAQLLALACLRAFPPPLEDAEYTALDAVWSGSQLELPQWVMQALVTAAIMGPRLLAHPIIGEQIKAFFGLGGGKAVAKPIAAGAAAPAPAPAQDAAPAQAPAASGRAPSKKPAESVQTADGVTVIMPRGAAAAWEGA